MVRLTVQGPKEAEASARIVERLRDVRSILIFSRIAFSSDAQSRHCLFRSKERRKKEETLRFLSCAFASQIGCTVPLAADIHFQPKVASLCADVFDKVRINPGNFVDGRKVWEEEGEDAETAQVATQISQAVISDGTEEEASGHRFKSFLFLFFPFRFVKAPL